MSLTEIWLRLLAVNNLPGELMLKAVQVLQNAQSAPITLRTLLTERQIGQFMAVSATTLTNSLRWLEQADHHLITADDSRYPALLREIVCYPGALFVAGNVNALRSAQLGVVGSRAHSWYGEYWGKQFTQQLAVSGLTITSGLAIGIDSMAHKAALAAGGCTVAVLGNGLQQIYPKRNQGLAEQILSNGGTLVSEFPLITTPWPGNFPRRNRIISGLSLGILVAEASLRSGSLVTARYALEQGREVFALPGPIGNPGCEGSNWLIKQGANPVTNPQEIISQLQGVRGWLAGSHLDYAADEAPATDALPEGKLLASVGDEVTTVDVIVDRSGLGLATVAAQLLELEMAGLVASVPGGYVRLRKLG